MPRWRPRLLQSVRCPGPLGSAPLGPALLLLLVTFGLVLPLCCHRLLYSYYYLRPVFLDAMSDAALEQSLANGRAALRYWHEHANEPYEPSEGAELLLTVVTATRHEARDFHYVLQVTRRLNDMLASCAGRTRCADVLICDVEHGANANEDAVLLEKRFKVVRRSAKERDADTDTMNTFEREKRDYVFCLRKGLELTRAQNVLVLEDDAEPRSDFFSVVYELLTRPVVKRSLYVKLYHPERLQRYWNPEPWRLAEWAGLGAVLATALLLALAQSVSLSRANLLFFTLYFMAAAELFGRHYLLELRRLSPQLYAVAPATECCTPAMLFPGNASLRAAAMLDAAACSRGNAKDTVLYRAMRSSETARSVEPNIVRHIGAFSSVRPNNAAPKLL